MIDAVIREMKHNELGKTLQVIHKSLIISNGPDYPKKIIDYQAQVHYTEEWLKKKIETNYFIVATVNAEIVGVGSAKKNELQHIFIDPDYQKNGIGKAIVTHLEQYCKELNYTEVVLEPSITGLEFYKKLGYELIKNEPVEWLGEKLQAMLMKKKL